MMMPYQKKNVNSFVNFFIKKKKEITLFSGSDQDLLSNFFKT
jgi:hypothetical protein